MILWSGWFEPLMEGIVKSWKKWTDNLIRNLKQGFAKQQLFMLTIIIGIYQVSILVYDIIVKQFSQKRCILVSLFLEVICVVQLRFEEVYFSLQSVDLFFFFFTFRFLLPLFFFSLESLYSIQHQVTLSLMSYRCDDTENKYLTPSDLTWTALHTSEAPPQRDSYCW